ENDFCILTANDLEFGCVDYGAQVYPALHEAIGFPLITAYALRDDPNDTVFYLGCADGCLFQVDVSDRWHIKFIELAQVNPIGQAMCHLGTILLENSQNNCIGDVLLYAGESADSQVCHCTLCSERDNHPFLVLETLINRAPIVDFEVESDTHGNQDTFITCSGQDRQGSLCVIGYGRETRILSESLPEWRGVTNLWSTTISVDEHQKRTCLVAGSSLDTKIVLETDEGFVDVTKRMHIISNQKTIMITSISDTNDRMLLLQVYSNGLVLIDSTQGDILLDWAPKEMGLHESYEIILATSWDTMLGKVKLYICLSDGQQNQVQLIDITWDPSSDIRFVHKESLGIGCTAYYARLTTLHSLASTSAGSFAVPSSVACLNSRVGLHGPPIQYLLVGLRQGTLLCYRVNPTFSSTSPKCGPILCRSPVVCDLGSYAIRFTVEAPHTIFALSDRLWRIECNELRRHALDIEKVFLQKPTSVSALAYLGTNYVLPLNTKILAMVEDCKLLLFDAGQGNRPTTRKIILGETPRKIIRNNLSDYSITITSASVGPTRKNTIRLLDTFSGKSLTNSQPLWVDKDLEKSGYRVLSSAEWNVQYRERKYKYLCIGIGHPRDHQQVRHQGTTSKSGMDSGALLLYRLKQNDQINTSTKYTLLPVWNQDHLQDGVFAICPHSAGLLFSAGSTIHLYQLNSENGRLTEIAHKTLRFLITSIHVADDRICITSQTESISFYKFNNDTKKLEFLKSDTVARTVHHALVLNSRVAVGVCQAGGFVALHDDPDDKSFERRLLRLFSFYYPDIVIKSKLGSMQTRYIVPQDENRLATHILPWTADIVKDDQQAPKTNEAIKPIIGCTVAGGIVTIHRISAALYMLLLALQERILEYQPTSPLLGSTRDFHAWYCQQSSGQKNTVHGDLIAMYSRLSLAEQEEIICLQQKTMLDIADATLSFLRLYLPLSDVGNEKTLEMESDCELLVLLQKEERVFPAQQIAFLLRRLVDAFERYC
ncbi:hypothetical protein DFQ30_008986, partial [Apophysomyces sp. BC1015]